MHYSAPHSNFREWGSTDGGVVCKTELQGMIFPLLEISLTLISNGIVRFHRKIFPILKCKAVQQVCQKSEDIHLFFVLGGHHSILWRKMTETNECSVSFCGAEF